MAAKKKRKKTKPKPGKRPLAPGEATLRETVRLPESIHARMMRKIKARRNPNISKYLRKLVERDLAAVS